MATGVFHTARSGQSLKYRARVKRDKAIARFADAMAASAGTEIDGNVRLLAEQLGMSPSAGHAMMQRIKRDLGSQAR